MSTKLNKSWSKIKKVSVQLEDVLGDLVKDEEDFGRRKSKVEVWIKVKLRKK